MKKARLRALTQFCLLALHVVSTGRNEESPFKGIDTTNAIAEKNPFTSRNEESPFKGIDTCNCCLIFFALLP